MTGIETGVITGGVLSIFAAGVAWGIMRSRILSHGKYITAIERRVVEHEKSVMPHLVCPSHDATLHAILASLAEIKADLKTMAGQIFVMSRNGKDAE